MFLYLLWTRLNFAVGLLIVEFIVCAHLQKRRLFPLWLVLGSIPSIAASLVWNYIPIGGIWWTSFKFIFIFALTTIMPIAAFKADGWSYLFVGILSYCVQHISYQTYSIIDVLSGPALSAWAKALILILISALYYIALYFFFVRKRPKGQGFNVNNYTLLLLSGAVLIVTVVISFLGAVFSMAARRMDLLVVICLFSIISCSLAMFMEISLLTLKKDEIELSILKHMLYESRHQYADSKESIEIINVKCHDLRHQLSALKGKEYSEELSRISDAINIYDSSFKTGNDALDVVLTEKGLLCRNKGIRLTCMLDGTILSSMKQSDIYSLFGNAIENAVDSVSGLDEDRRVISIRQIKRQGFGIIMIENYYDGILSFEGGLPITDKDKNFHGFGMKSMKMIVEEYGGEMRASVSGDIFRLEIILVV